MIALTKAPRKSLLGHCSGARFDLVTLTGEGDGRSVVLVQASDKSRVYFVGTRGLVGAKSSVWTLHKSNALRMSPFYAGLWLKYLAEAEPLLTITAISDEATD